MRDLEQLKAIVEPKKEMSKTFFLELLDAERQKEYEDMHMEAVLSLLKIYYINRYTPKRKELMEQHKKILERSKTNASSATNLMQLVEEIKEINAKLDEYKCFFVEPYFARMDLYDDKEGYNSYYIGKRGDLKMQIVDWRAPLARRYYQKSSLNFKINEYTYKLILRRALRTFNGKVLDFRNEYLSVKDYLSKEEIGGRDDEIIFDPYLKDILKSRKEKQEITDIIETIQERQYEIITLPEQDEFVVQGVAGSGKTMILLHRLSYLMYNNERIHSGDVVVITPSDSFNAFIDELAEILELERVRTMTLESYFLRVLKNQGVDLTKKIQEEIQPPQEYLSYLYSPAFEKEVERKVARIYDDVRGIINEEGCREISEEVQAVCEESRKGYERIKNASIRIRRCVLGEIKEKVDGGLYYTKQFRYLFNCVSDLLEFFQLNFTDQRMDGYGYFFKQILIFYKAIKFIRKYSQKILQNAKDDLTQLYDVLEKEIFDLKRYKQQSIEGEVYTYKNRIEHRESSKKEIEGIISVIEQMQDGFVKIYDYADVILSDGYLVSIGKCENMLDLTRFFYREIVKKAKRSKGFMEAGITHGDPFALCLILTKLGLDLTPKFGFVFVDEAQDISPTEYKVLRTINNLAKFNIFGDLKQNITGYRGLTDWSILQQKVYELNLNYRNTNQIVEFVSNDLGIDMKPIGFDGEEISRVGEHGVTKYLTDKNGLRAVIVSENNFEKFKRKSYNVIRESGRISKKKINYMTVYESKGLEFTAVVVVDDDLTQNEKYIAYTRALKELAIVQKGE